MKFFADTNVIFSSLPAIEGMTFVVADPHYVETKSSDGGMLTYQAGRAVTSLKEKMVAAARVAGHNAILGFGTVVVPTAGGGFYLEAYGAMGTLTPADNIHPAGVTTDYSALDAQGHPRAADGIH